MTLGGGRRGNDQGGTPSVARDELRDMKLEKPDDEDQKTEAPKTLTPATDIERSMAHGSMT